VIFRKVRDQEKKDGVMNKTNLNPPLRPMGLANFRKIDEELVKIIGAFWKHTWVRREPAIDPKTKYLLSLANAVGAGRLRQAARELINLYAAGTTTAELDELFGLFVWNQGAGHFASEIGPSTLFAAYRFIADSEAAGQSREQIVKQLTARFGESNPDVGVAPPEV